MADETVSSKSNIGWGLFAAAIGAFIVAGASGLFGYNLQTADETPQWIGVCAGAIFLAGGIAVMLAGVKPGPDGGLSPDAPRWLKAASLALALFIAGDFVALFAWIAFGPGERHFSTSTSFGGIHTSGAGNETIGRVAFGFGAAFCGAVFIAFLVTGVRQLWRRDQSQQ
ncbi:MAG TPA: hypothetical protein VKT73_14255 [Xanthobacteraceae bacterium]|nr:hypothetical protein [Xanthobacteraceae bacterium]